MKKILVMLMLVIGVVSFSALAQNGKKSKINNFSNKKVSFSTITIKLKGTKLRKNKKVYTEKNFQINGKNPKIITNKVISKKMIENFIESDDEIVITRFYENNEGMEYKPFDFSFSIKKDEVKKIYFKDGAIYIWDN